MFAIEFFCDDFNFTFKTISLFHIFFIFERFRNFELTISNNEMFLSSFERRLKNLNNSIFEFESFKSNKKIEQKKCTNLSSFDISIFSFAQTFIFFRNVTMIVFYRIEFIAFHLLITFEYVFNVRQRLWCIFSCRFIHHLKNHFRIFSWYEYQTHIFLYNDES